MRRSLQSIALSAVLLALLAAPPPASADGRTARDVGLVLLPLAPEDLDSIQRASGHRVGVMVSKVDDDSAAARAGIKKGDMILAFGPNGVDSPDAVDKVMPKLSGKVEVGLLRVGEDGKLSVLKVSMQMPADGIAGDAKPAEGPAPTASAADVRARLKALEDAHTAGVITDEEYARKKAELEAKLRAAAAPLSETARKKLQALEEARKAGVITEAEYARKRAAIVGGKAAPAAPPARGAAASAAAKPSKEPLIAATRGKVFHHPIGFQFVQPADWKVVEQGNNLVLSPPNPATGPQGPLEIYLITGERVDTEGIERPDDPRVAEFLDAQVKQIAPTLARQGQPGTLDTSSGKAVVLDWLAKNEKGQEVLARCYVNVIKGHGIALAGIGIRDKVEARDPALRRMFVSFGMAEGKQDPQLVGAWSLSGTYALTNWSTYENAWSRAKLASETQSTLRLAADGTWSRVTESQTLAGGAGIWLESNSRKAAKGKWYAGDGLLYLVTDDDLWETYKYRLEGEAGGRALRLASEKTGTAWKEAR